jgi:hypothetical protein
MNEDFKTQVIVVVGAMIVMLLFASIALFICGCTISLPPI